MLDRSISDLLNMVTQRYGDACQPWPLATTWHQYDVQVEGVPPGDYVYTADVTLKCFPSFIEQFRRPLDGWP